MPLTHTTFLSFSTTVVVAGLSHAERVVPPALVQPTTASNGLLFDVGLVVEVAEAISFTDCPALAPVRSGFVPLEFVVPVTVFPLMVLLPLVAGPVWPPVGIQFSLVVYLSHVTVHVWPVGRFAFTLMSPSVNDVVTTPDCWP